VRHDEGADSIEQEKGASLATGPLANQAFGDQYRDTASLQARRPL
jgi:hypothetical protein